jgi:hypothetical protein
VVHKKFYYRISKFKHVECFKMTSQNEGNATQLVFFAYLNEGEHKVGCGPCPK